MYTRWFFTDYEYARLDVLDKLHTYDSNGPKPDGWNIQGWSVNNGHKTETPLFIDLHDGYNLVQQLHSQRQHLLVELWRCAEYRIRIGDYIECTHEPAAARKRFRVYQCGRDDAFPHLQPVK